MVEVRRERWLLLLGAPTCKPVVTCAMVRISTLLEDRHVLTRVIVFESVETRR